MARLVYVPVVHSIAEMGSAAEAYRAAFAARYGERKLAERSTEFDAIWRAIGEGIRSLRLDLKHVKLYQDSLPVCGHERALVHQIAAQGSRNHQLLEALADSGASLVGTESPSLLLDEYRLMQSPERTEAQAAALLDARDQFIAARVDETLGNGATGILFIGALHHVAKFLPKRISVEYLAVRKS
jgi:hypothetical protein